MGQYYLRLKQIDDPEARISASMKLLYVSGSGGPLELIKQSPEILDLESMIHAKARHMHKHVPTKDPVTFEIRTGNGRRIERMVFEYGEED